MAPARNGAPGAKSDIAPARRRLVPLAALFVAALLGLGIVAYFTLGVVKVNGPIYHDIIAGKDLIADVLPPPLYIVESYLIALRALEQDDPRHTEAIATKLATLQDLYASRQAHWRMFHPSGPLADRTLAGSLLDDSRAAAARFQTALFDRFLPALRAGERDRARRIAALELEPDYEAHRRAIDIVVERAKRHHREAEAEAQRLVATRGLLLGLLFLAAAALFAALSRAVIAGVARNQEELERRVAERTADLRELAAELAETEERERREIAAELHDRIGQTLALAKIKVAAAGATGAAAQPPLREAAHLIDGSIADIRTLLVELSPPAFHELDLGAALGWLCDEATRRFGLTVDTEIDEPLPDLPGPHRLALLKGARELLANAAKHSGAARAGIRLAASTQGIELEVSDRGAGCDPARIEDGPSRSGGRFGLFSLRERIGRLGGSFTVRTAPGAGMQVTVTLPLPAPPSAPR